MTNTPARLAVAPSRVRVYIEDMDGAQINHVEAQAAVDYASGLVFTSMWPKGYATANFRLRRCDIFAGFEVRESYGVVIRDGVRIVWQGRLEGIKQVVSGGDEYLDCRAVGWYVVLQEHLIRKRWLDTAPFANSTWPSDYVRDDTQLEFVTQKRDNWLHVRASAQDLARTDGETYRELYEAYAEIDEVYYAYRGRTGESMSIDIYNVDQAAAENNKITVTSTPGGASGTKTVTLAQGATTSIYFMVIIEAADTYDQNDYMQITDAVVYANYDSAHSAYGSEAYTTGELIEDVLLLVDNATSVLSTDYSQLTDPGYAVDAFTIEKHSRAGDVIQRLIDYGDTSYNTYGLSVWDRTGASDALPRVEVKQFDTSDYDYIVDINDQQIATFQRERDGSQLYNYIIVEYIDDDGITRTRTPDDNANLKNTASIATDYRREKVLSIGKASTDDADNLGRQYLQYHAERRFVGSIALSGDVRTKSGLLVPACWVRAGDRLKIANLDTTILLRHVSYDAETGRLTVSPETPPNRVEMKIAALKAANSKAVIGSATVG
jgi:hypothetical protein